MSSNSDGASGFCSCLVWVVVVTFNIFVGEWSVNYLLQFFLNKVIPFWGAALIGLFTAEISVPVAIVIALLRLFHVM